MALCRSRAPARPTSLAISFARGAGASLWLAAGTIHIAGNINLGLAGNLIDSGSGPATISGMISGEATSGLAQVQGLIGTYFNLPYLAPTRP